MNQEKEAPRLSHYQVCSLRAIFLESTSVMGPRPGIQEAAGMRKKGSVYGISLQCGFCFVLTCQSVRYTLVDVHT